MVAATDERQAGIVFRTAVRMVELHPELETRVVPYQDRLVVPERGASFAVPARPSRSGWRAWTRRWQSSTRSA